MRHSVYGRPHTRCGSRRWRHLHRRRAQSLLTHSKVGFSPYIRGGRASHRTNVNLLETRTSLSPFIHFWTPVWVGDKSTHTRTHTNTQETSARVYLSSCMVLWKSCWLSSATRGPEQGHVRLIDLVATEPHLLHLMSCSWYRTLFDAAKVEQRVQQDGIRAKMRQNQSIRVDWSNQAIQRQTVECRG